MSNKAINTQEQQLLHFQLKTQPLLTALIGMQIAKVKVNLSHTYYRART